jgi:hypothetical protein
MPTISGTMVDRRDHVLMIRLLRACCAANTLFINFGSMYGPFFNERGMTSPAL